MNGKTRENDGKGFAKMNCGDLQGEAFAEKR